MTARALAALGLLALAARALAAPLALVPDVTVGRQAFAVYGAARRDVITVTAPSSFAAMVEIPADARLVTAVAVPDRVWTTSLLDKAVPLRVRILFEGEGTSENVTLYERVIDVAGAPRDRRWFDVGRDLRPLAGRRGRVRFDAVPAQGGDPAGTVVTWAPPEILACAGDEPSLVLVVLDALRADHLGAAGYARPTSPHLDALAGDATRFATAIAGAPKTIPSVPQIMTGRSYPVHRQGKGLSGFLGDGRFTLSRAVVNNPFVSTWLGTEDPGFQTLVSADALDARAITSEALRWLTAIGRCRSALYLHYLDTHTPYRPPPRWARRFIDPAAKTTIGLSFDDVTGAWQNRYGAADRRRIVDLYDGALAWTDRQLGRLVRGLARRGRLDTTLLVVTADHGEELWDHGSYFHGQSLYDELLHVPLLVRFPGGLGRGRVVDDVVSTLDILPTIADVARFPPPAGDGESLIALARGDQPPGRARSVYATVSYAEPRTPARQAVRSATHKLIRTVDTGALEVYDLTTDPHEHRDLGPAAPGARDLLATLDAARLRIAAAGLHVRLRSTAERPVRYLVTLATDPPAPIVNADRLSLEPTDRLTSGPRSSTLVVAGLLEPGGEDEVRMDVLVGTGRLTLAVTLDGVAAPAGTVELGAQGAPGGATLDLADPALLGEPRAPRPEGSGTSPPREITVALWRATGTTAAAPALDDATRERLRQLGYVE